MGIYIPNMSKPKDCSECILADKHLNGLYEAKYYCRLEADYEHCPLVEIPTPHGRLGDLDVLLEESLKEGAYNYVDSWQIAEQPTILEEE